MNEIKHWMVTDERHIFFGLEFRGHIVKIGGEDRVWNDDTQGQSYPLASCQEV